MEQHQDIGLMKNNTRKFINITKLAEQLGKDVCNALPAYHAFTGCDYTASFMRKGKVRPYKLMAKSKRYIKAFGELGEQEEVDKSVISAWESFVCDIYSKPKVKHVNDAR